MFLETGDWHPSGQPSSPFLFPGQCSDRPCASSPPLGKVRVAVHRAVPPPRLSSFASDHPRLGWGRHGQNPLLLYIWVLNFYCKLCLPQTTLD